MAEDFHEDGISEFVFGAPGELTVDASHGKAAFPVPDTTLSFPSEDHFLKFMSDNFNARVEWDQEAGKWVPVVETTTLGIPFTTDASGTTLVEVLSPVSTFLGGPGGYYLVGGKAHCVDPARCSLECSPPPMATSTVVQTAGFFSSAPPPGALTPATSLAPAQASLHSISSLFDVEVGSSIALAETDPGNANPYVRASVHTKQSSGPKPYEVTICKPPALQTLMNGITVKMPGVCSTKVLNSNVLTLEVDFESTHSWDYCVHGTILSPRPIVQNDVPRVSYEANFALYKPGALSGLKAEGSGTEPSGATTYRNHCYSSGCFKRDPCN